MNERDEPERTPAWLTEAVGHLRASVDRRPGAVDEVVRAALASTADRGADEVGDAGVWGWWTRPRLVLSPLSAAAWAGGVALLVLFVARISGPEAVPGAAAGTAPVQHQFVLVAPDAASVSLVGDFNGWNVEATPLTPAEPDGGVWTVEVPLDPGRHTYSFVVDGREWVPDTSAPRAPEDEFGRPSSVIVVTERGT